MKIVQVRDSDYKLQVQNGGQIVLDTGPGFGQVYITGDLFVAGATTTVNSTTLTVDDNIIIINDGEAGAGVTLGQAGIQIDRGSSPDAIFVFNETVSHYSPTSATTVFGTFEFKNQSNVQIGIKTNSIMTGGSSLALIGSGNGVLTVQGTNNYEQQVLNYANPLLPAINDDYIPNMKAVTDYVAAAFVGVLQPGIQDGDTSVFTKDQSSLNNPLPSVIEFKVDNTLIAEMNSTGLDVGNVSIGGNIITNTSINNLEITSNTLEVEMNAILSLQDQPDPSPTAGACKLYTKSAVGSGNTGIYYVNTKVDYDGSTVVNLQDELISRKRALLFSIIF
jgi:hypothetical protein